MMKNAMMVLPLVACMLACGNKGVSTPTDTDNNEEKTELSAGKGSEECATDSVGFESETKEATVQMWADFPKGSNAILNNAIREYISEKMGGSYMGDLSNADSMTVYYVREAQKELKARWDEFDSPEAPTLHHDVGIKKLYESEKYVTFHTGEEVYYGGAHGSWISEGITFRKSDGRRFDWNMFRNTDKEEFHLMLKEGVRSYFAENNADEELTDENLKDMLLVEGSIDYLPLPQFPPYLTSEGISFCYQQYEIAPYAAGLPSFTIPVDKLRPYLTATALQMID
ncbi:MAG: DUF3298 domain-containing protein [Prevotella sp.]|nr:DUF3298 domain-containing protein [Prevotella sp.]